MKVYFIGAGPGAYDLITVRGANILRRVPVVLYAGSLVPPEVLRHCHTNAQLVNTADLNLDEQVVFYRQARNNEHDVARLHSGDPAIYGAVAEQMRRLDELDIEYEVVPGVSSFTAAAASIKTELTKPEVSQTIILTRVSGRASPVPQSESIAELALHRSTMCIFLSGPHLRKIVRDLLKHYPSSTPVALIYRASSPDERVHVSSLGLILHEVDIKDWKLTTMMLVGDALSKEITAESRLYSKEYAHLFRPVPKVDNGLTEQTDNLSSPKAPLVQHPASGKTT